MKFYEPRTEPEGPLFGRIFIHETRGVYGGLSGQFEAKFKGKVLCKSSSPLVRASNILLQQGYSPEYHLEMVHENTGEATMGGPIGRYAFYKISEEVKENA